VRLDVVPAPGAVPIYIAAGGERMTEVAAAEADGVFVHLVNREMTEHTLATIARAARAAGRDPDDIPVSNLLMTCVDDDRTVACDAMRHYLVDYYLNMPSYQRVMERAGYGEVVDTIRDRLAHGDRAGAAAAIPDSLLDEFTIAGDPAECEQKLADFVSWGTREPILYAFPARGDWLAGYHRVIDAFAPRPAVELA
jgi:alkanesulfonate monooxygenase SsuD/methylene tetrahydromethanopterin reductase-like flavin-dependent oxidoreductase (luciferase family)